MRVVDHALAAAAALAVALGIAHGSSVPTTPHASDGGVLRLAWTARPERVEDCREQSNEALEKLPAHMRQAVVCEGTTASYRLEVRREGQLLADQVVRGGGLHHDRPLYVFREIAMPAGDIGISVRVTRIESTASGSDGRGTAGAPAIGAGSGEPGIETRAIDPERRRRERQERLWQRAEAVPATLLLENRFHFEPRTVVLVTYDADKRQLLAVEGPRR